MSKPFLKKLEKKINKNLEILREAIKESMIKEEDLPKMLAEAWVWNELWKEDYENLRKVASDYERVLDLYGKEKLNPKLSDPETTRTSFLIEMADDSSSKAAKLLQQGHKIQKSNKAKQMANARHNKPGGSREKQNLIRKKWASGKYSSRDICAEQECADLGMSFSTARKALRNMPNP
jgi:hypothetical protein